MTKHFLSLMFVGTALWAQSSFQVDVIGKGKPMILIPGFSSSGKTWDSTVAHYKAKYQCHVVTLAGFAGVTPIASPSLETVRKDLAAYIRKNKLDKPVIVGHSMGGFLALWLAEQEPDLVGPLVIVDSLPFLAGVWMPGATVESVKPMAEGMRKMYSGPANEQSDKMAESAIKPMVTKPEEFEMIRGWSRKSDRQTEGTTMYEMMTTDLRGDLGKIASPALVIGTWIGYAEYGATRVSVEKSFRDQYTALKGYQFTLSDKARHFVMLDDPTGFFEATDGFLLGRAKSAVAEK
jgi:N-formylmaleamate deformylase